MKKVLGGGFTQAAKGARCWGGGGEREERMRLRGRRSLEVKLMANVEPAEPRREVGLTELATFDSVAGRGRGDPCVLNIGRVAKTASVGVRKSLLSRPRCDGRANCISEKP